MDIREAISILKTWRVFGDKEHEAFDMAISALQVQDVSDTNVGDMISRQAAIDELKRISFSHWFECGEYLSEDTREIEIISSSKALEVIEALPTAQPEIIHCKDCKYYSPMNKETKTGICNLTMHQNFGDNWFCAGAERRTDEGGSDR